MSSSQTEKGEKHGASCPCAYDSPAIPPGALRGIGALAGLLALGVASGADAAARRPMDDPFGASCTSNVFQTPVVYPPTPSDLDQDGIDDQLEQRLLNLFAPITRGNQISPDYQDPGGAPVSVSWMLRNGVQCQTDDPGFEPNCCGDGACQSPDCDPCIDALGYRTVAQWLADVTAPSANGGLVWHIAFNWRRVDRFGGSVDPAERRSWQRATHTPEHTYGRVWKPWPLTHPHLLSIQYYSFYTNNDTVAPFGFGNHEGDWGTIDLTVDIEADEQAPPVLNMIFHNHGRQFFMTPQFMPAWLRRPIVYLERGSNEPWPNPGSNGHAGWPQQDGWATNRDFDIESPGCQVGYCADEADTCRVHLGEGYEIDWLAGDGVVPNIGDNGVSLCGIEGEFLQKYRGRWGRVTGPNGSCPESPVFQSKAVNRCWKRGPWASVLASPAGAPFADTAFTLWTTEGYEWNNPLQQPVVYTDDRIFVGRLQGTGTIADPYASFALGVAMTQPHGTLRLIRPSSMGPFSAPRHIVKPLTLEAIGGPVTLGVSP